MILSSCTTLVITEQNCCQPLSKCNFIANKPDIHAEKAEMEVRRVLVGGKRHFPSCVSATRGLAPVTPALPSTETVSACAFLHTADQTNYFHCATTISSSWCDFFKMMTFPRAPRYAVVVQLSFILANVFSSCVDHCLNCKHLLKKMFFFLWNPLQNCCICRFFVGPVNCAPLTTMRTKLLRNSGDPRQRIDYVMCAAWEGGQ